ncbi:DUF2059 domain-containing protein [Halopseudomonas pelagia]|uniref:DUF2059 domain-containing protein n=1 Tax=Halopseudomonas pelagia TaxID=553151 RepID=UPI00039BD5E0|nr:DUF2059 domain-containing protein [Halopseudomonas pelagia]|tara:strand:- start:920 stop:1666 length:747 start_codon:yes stop_codon:yes gene_type:complete
MRLKPLHLLIMSLLAALALTTMSARANTDRLYELSGMATHQTHFQHALTAAQQRYAQQLPRNVYESLVRQSNQRFAPQAMTDRAQARLALAMNASSHEQAVAFYESALGGKIVALETQATSATSVAAMQRGIPQMEVSTERLTTLRQLSVSLPALELGVEVSMSLANLATQSANDLLGGLFQVPGNVVDSRRDTLRGQMQPDLPNTLAYVYRDLSDTELQQYLDWAQSEAGRNTSRAMELAAKDALNP